MVKVRRGKPQSSCIVGSFPGKLPFFSPFLTPSPCTVNTKTDVFLKFIHWSLSHNILAGMSLILLYLFFNLLSGLYQLCCLSQLCGMYSWASLVLFAADYGFILSSHLLLYLKNYVQVYSLKWSLIYNAIKNLNEIWNSMEKKIFHIFNIVHHD